MIESGISLGYLPFGPDHGLLMGYCHFRSIATETPIRVRREEICAQTGLSERTVRRYVAQYRAQGFAGLQPRPKASRRSEDAVPEALVQEAILLRREVPRRSVSQIIQILEWEGRAVPGQIKH
ncbi:helix-turn-helix domain-containing protein [Sulfobacillus thermosulfidooxidans]|nr:helix-turn-helix domain-containing protein [Sulfobacillus thermosulfidooxidans]